MGAQGGGDGQLMMKERGEGGGGRERGPPNEYLPLLFNNSEAPSFVINSKAGRHKKVLIGLR